MQKLSTNTFNGGKVTDTTKVGLKKDSFLDAENLVFLSEGEDLSAVPFKGVSKHSWSKQWHPGKINAAFNFKCIGAKESEQRDRVFFFLKGESPPLLEPGEVNENEFLIEFTRATGVFRVILGGIDIGLTFDNKIYTHNISHIVTGDDEYLAWTDNNEAPRLINIETAYGYSEQVKLDVYPDEATTLALINLIKAPPSKPIVYEYSTDEALSVSSVREVFISFKYRYIYLDGSVSAFSIVSKFVPLSALDNKDYYINTSSINVVNITYEVDNELVEYVEIAFKEGDKSLWYTLDREDAVVGVSTLKFANNSKRIPLGIADIDIKYFDNIPISSRTLAYSNSRIVLGGFTEGYDEVKNIEGLAYPNYTGITNYVNISTIISSPYRGTLITLADITANTNEGDILSVSINSVISLGLYGSTDTTLIIKSIAIFQVTIPVGYTNVLTIIGDAYIASSYFTSTVPGEEDPYTAVYSIATDELSLTYEESNIAVNIFSVDSFAGVPSSNSTLKSGRSHAVGIMYYDDFNRSNDVALSDNLTMYVKYVGERVVSINETIGNTSLGLYLTTTPPIWAKKYCVVLSEIDTSPPIYQGVTMGAGTSIELPDTIIYTVKAPQDVDTEVVFKDFDYVEGQHVVILGGYFNDSSWVYRNVEASAIPITGTFSGDGLFKFYMTPNNYAQVTSICESYNINPDYLFFEIVQLDFPSTGVYNEVGEVLEILNPGAYNRSHQGNISNQIIGNEVLYTTIPTERYASNIYRLTDSTLANERAIGDFLTIGTVPATIFQIDLVDDEDWVYVYTNSPLENISHDVQYSQPSHSIVNTGNAYGHYREFVVDKPSEWTTINYYCESYDISDFVASANIGYGRFQVEVDGLKQEDRFNWMIGSSELFEDTNFFGLTNFPNTSYPFIDLESNNGAIEALMSRNNDIIVIQSFKTGRVLVKKSILTTATGDGSVTQTDIVFGQYVPYNLDEGTKGQMWSVRNIDGVIYFKDDHSAFRLSNDGLTEISDYGMSDEFHDGTSTLGLSAVSRRRSEYITELNGRMEAFNERLNVWVGAITVTPDFMTEIEDTIASLQGHEHGAYLFLHDDNLIYSQLFDNDGDLVQVTPKLKLAVNTPQGETKKYNSIELYGDKLDDAVITNVKTNTATSPDILSLQLNEDSWVATTNGGLYEDSLGREFVGVGVPLSLDSTGYTSVGLNTGAISVGDTLAYVDDSGDIINTGTIISISETFIGCTTIDLNQTDKTFLVIKNTAIEGSDLLGRYLEMQIEIPTISHYFILTSISTFGNISELHEK